MNILTRAFRAIAPGWALGREVARAKIDMVDQGRKLTQAHFDAAERSRTTADWSRRNTSADMAITDDLPAINARARLHARNDWIARSIIDGYRRHVIGKGIRCWSDARDEDGEPHSRFNAAADRLFWDNWAMKPERCDIERRKTLTEIQGLLVEEMITVGEAIVIWSYRRQADHVGLKLQLIEPEQLARDRYIAPGTGNEIRHGIEIGKHGEPVAYWIYTEGHPLEAFNVTEPERVPANRVLHFMRQNRVRQTHGVSRFAPVLKKMLHLGMYEDYTLVRARLEACIGMVIESTPDAIAGGPVQLGIGSANNQTDEEGNEDFTFEPGMNYNLPPGRTAKFNTPTTPGNTFEPFTLHQTHAISAGSGLDFGTVAKDYRQGSFISLRMGTLERDREIEPLQQLLVDLVMRPIRELFIELAIMEGRLEVPEGEDFFGDDDAYDRLQKSNWRPPAKPPIDPADHFAAAKIAIEQRLRSRASFIEETEGVPWKEIMDQIDDEHEYAIDELGIGLPDATGEDGTINTSTSPSEPRPTRTPTPNGSQKLNGHTPRLETN